MTDPAPVSIVVGTQSVLITGVAAGPNTPEDNAQTVSFTVSLFSDPTAHVITDLSIDSGTNTISYTPTNVGQAVITVESNDGQFPNSTTT